MNGSFTNIANYTNTFDAASRITSEVLNGGAPTTYQYDKTNQLTNDSLVSYSFDLNGNRTMTGYTTGPANEIASDGTWNYYTDKNGNMVQKINISTGEVFAYSFDVGNRMTGVTDTTTSGLQMQGTYIYDALNQRIQKDVWTGGLQRSRISRTTIRKSGPTSIAAMPLRRGICARKMCLNCPRQYRAAGQLYGCFRIAWGRYETS